MCLSCLPAFFLPPAAYTMVGTVRIQKIPRSDIYSGLFIYLGLVQHKAVLAQVGVVWASDQEKVLSKIRLPTSLIGVLISVHC